MYGFLFLFPSLLCPAGLRNRFRRQDFNFFCPFLLPTPVLFVVFLPAFALRVPPAQGPDLGSTLVSVRQRGQSGQTIDPPACSSRFDSGLLQTGGRGAASHLPPSLFPLPFPPYPSVKADFIMQPRASPENIWEGAASHHRYNDVCH